MKVTQEKLPDSEIGLEIEISAENSQKTYEKVVQNLSKSVNIPGFRKGKVPRSILLQRLGGSRVKAAALEELVQDSIKKAVEQEKIDSLGKYKLRSDFEELLSKYEPGEPLTVLASVEVPPEVELADYQNLQVKAVKTVSEPEAVEKILEERRAAKATLIPVEDRPAAIGDLVTVDYQGKEESPEGMKPVEGVEATDFQMELQAGRYIEGLVEAIVGMKVEESKEIPLTFPEDYPREDLASKAVIFAVKIKEIKEKELPELDDEFAQEVSEFETLEQLRESLVKQEEEKAEAETKKAIQEAILAELIKQNTIELPASMVEAEIDRMLTQTAMELQRMGIDIKQIFQADSIPAMRDRSRPEAIQKIKEDLIIKTIAEKENLQPEPTAVRERIKEWQAQLAGQKIDQDRLKKLVEEDLRTEMTLDWLVSKTTVEFVTKTETEESPAEETSEIS